jgi:hypothetical protein
MRNRLSYLSTKVVVVEEEMDAVETLVETTEEVTVVAADQMMRQAAPVELVEAVQATTGTHRRSTN